MAKIGSVSISLCDPLNDGFGYQIEIEDATGRRLLFSSRDPATGKDLTTYADALRVAEMYIKWV